MRSFGFRFQVVFFCLVGAIFTPLMQSQVSFATPPTYNGGGAVFLADFNGDGKTDILTSSGTMNLGIGDGSFTTGTSVSGTTLAIGDFNGDGRTDLLQQGTGTLAVLLGNGNGTFQPPISTNSGAMLESVAAGDLNGDGYADVVGVFNGYLLVYLGKGDGTFFPAVSYNLSSSSYVETTLLDDFNGDGKLDVLLLANGTPDQELVLLGNGDGTLQLPKTSTCISDPIKAVAGDFNGDGKLDLSVSGSPFVAIQLGNGDGTFQAPITVTNTAGPATLVAADFNGDGKVDLVVGDEGFVDVYLGNGDGAFSNSDNYRAPLAGAGALAVGDFNQDGKNDAVVTGGVFLGNGDGTFQAWPAIPLSYVPEIYPAVGDFDKNGFNDLAVLSGGLTIYLNNGSGVLSLAHTYTLSQSGTITSMATADVNGDGNLDLLLAGTGTAQNGYLTVLLGNGDGSFGTPSVYPLTTALGGPLVVADFNNDHKLDIVVPGMILLGNGDGTFGAASDFFDGSATWIVSADFNGDGNTDLAACSASGIAILLGNGDGTFQPASFPFSLQFSKLSTGDINGDGKEDLVGSGLYSSGLQTQVLLGNGDGTFTPINPGILTGADITVNDLADVDGDGKLDLVVSLFVPEGRSYGGFGSGVYEGIFLGNGDGTFDPFTNVVTFVSGEVFYFEAFELATDLNGDGKPDIVIGDNPNPDMFTIMNTTPLAAETRFLPTSVTFPAQARGTTSTPVPILLGNLGNTTLTVTSVSVSGTNASQFGQTNNCTTLLPKANCTIDVTFTPTASGTLSADLVFADNAGTGSQSLLLTGTGDGGTLTLSATSLSFSGQPIGTVSGAQVSILTNAGNAGLAISSIAAVGSNSGDFGVSNNCGGYIAAGGNCSVSVTLTPSSAGTRAANVAIIDTAPGNPQMISLTGTGQDFSLMPTPSSATVTPGQTATYTVSITPIDGFDQVVDLTCSGAPAQSKCSVSPDSVILQGSKAATATVTVTTTAASAGLISPPLPRLSNERLAFWPSLSGLFGAVTVGFGRKHMRRILRTAVCAFICAIGLGWVGCGASSNSNSGGSSGTPTGSYSLKVSGTFSGSPNVLQHEANVSLVVQ